MVPMLLNQPPKGSDRDHSVRAWYLGSSALARDFYERFGVQIYEVYGSTETGIVTRHPPEEEVVSASCGKPNESTYDVQIVDDLDTPVDPGTVGEIVVRPREPWSMSNGYFRNPDATADAFRNLWFHTGDYARKDDSGYIYFVDRKSDSIRRRGENISSAEIESAVNLYPAVVENAAIAVPADIGEDEVKVCIVSKAGMQIDYAELISFLDKKLPYFMVPRYVETVESLPKTPNQKVQKELLRRAGEDGITESTWDRENHGIRLTR